MNERLPYLREKTAVLTTSSGCYIMKDKQHNIIYIGKAKNLRNRVTSYFREAADHLPKVAKMVSQVYDYDFIVTDSEFEALILECSLIKQHQPKYNILLKDDKGYSYIKISNEQYPRISAELQKKTQGTYIGPYISSYTTKQTVNEANKIFMLPTCYKKFPQDFGKQRPCLNFYIKRCMGVCTGNIPADEYNDIINQAIDYIKGGSTTSIEKLTQSMQVASENLNFELAAKIRDRISAIKNATENQKVIETNQKNTDIISIAKNGDNIAASILMYRNGKLFDKADFFLGESEETPNDYETFISQYYSGKNDIPRSILIDEELDNTQMLERYLCERANHNVSILTPKRGASLKLTMLAKNNASEFLAIKVGRTGKEIIALSELASLIGLDKTPEWVEMYDISNLASSTMVAGMVVFYNGRPYKKAYKRFSIKDIDIQNDYGSMQEVLKRRFLRYLEGEDQYFSKMPDLILLDGGKGHVNAVKRVLDEMGLVIPVFGVVKDSKHKTRGLTNEKEEISINPTKPAFKLLTQFQDEVHRFAINYMKSVHNKNMYELQLTKVKGVGIKKAQKLMVYYKTREAMKKASCESLAKVAGVNAEIALELYNAIQNNM